MWPGSAAAWWNDEWSCARRSPSTPSASGAGITDPIGTTPVLVRLHVGNFRFGAAKEDGSDLRFVAADDKTPLKHHMEKCDSLLGEALVWVSSAEPQAGRQERDLAVLRQSEGADRGGRQGHLRSGHAAGLSLRERGTPPQDSSVWANSAQTVGQPADGAIIGQGLRFDGQTALTLPGSPSLVVAEGARVDLVGLDQDDRAAAAGRAVQPPRTASNGLVIGLDNGVPFVEVTNAGTAQRSGAARRSRRQRGTISRSSPRQRPDRALSRRQSLCLTLAATLPALNTASR